MKRFLRVFLQVSLISVLVGILCVPVRASIEFTNYNAHILLAQDSSQVALNNVDKVSGWQEFSIIKNLASKQANEWVENYSGTLTISPGGSALPANNLIVSNSNALVHGPIAGGFSDAEKDNFIEFVQTDSNAFAYCCKNTSNALVYGLKNNSNTIVSYFQPVLDLAQSTSDAFVYCCKNVSNTLVYGVKHNSNVLASISVSGIEDFLAKANSRAIIYCCKNTSNAFKHAIKVYDDHQVYASDSTEQNFVYFKNGFTIGVHKTLVLNTPVPVTGNINLQDLGIIELQNDLYLGSNAYLTNGGIIDGNGYSLVLSCSFSIPENKQLHIVSDTIINGHGTTLFLEPHARIVVDHGVTLTLKNIRIKNTRNNLANPIIRPTGHGARVALQDVELALADDFIFRDGQLFIHDDVLVTGSSKFSYRSSQASYICDAATLGFDKNTTFFYYPSTNDNHLINLQSKTASVYLDGATLLTTHTGMRLSRGLLCFDNNVTLSSTGITRLGVDFSNVLVTQDVDDPFYSFGWSPDGQYLATGDTEGVLKVFKREELFSGSASPVFNYKIGGSLLSLSWSPDGQYLAAGDSLGWLKLLKREDLIAGVNVKIFNSDIGYDLWSLHWSPDNKYLATGAKYGRLKVFKKEDLISGSVSTLFNQDIGSDLWSLHWSPDGKYLAAGSNTGMLKVFSLALHILLDDQTNPIFSQDIGDYLLSLNWHPNGQILAVADSAQVHVFDMDIHILNNTKVNPVFSQMFFDNIYHVKWSPDGQYLVVIEAFGRVSIFSYDRHILIDSKTSPVFQYSMGVGLKVVDWSPDGNYLAIGDAIGYLKIFDARYCYDTNSQSFNNGIIFGDPSQPDGDLNVQVLAGARVNIIGKVLDDSSF